MEHLLDLEKNRTSSLNKHQIHLRRFLKIQTPAPDLLNQGLLLWDPGTF